MAFDLVIRFHGLHLFVPDGETVYVLMPAAGVPGGMMGMPPHVAMLCVDTAYLQQGSQQTMGMMALAPINQQHLPILGPDLPDASSLPPVLANIGDVARRPINPVAFRDNPPSTLLTARIGLRAGACTGTGPAQCFAYPPSTPPQPLVSVIEWTVFGIDGDTLDLAPAGFPGMADSVIPTLYPIDGTIHVEVYHTERDALPPDPQMGDGTDLMHFGALYILFDPPVANGPVPQPAPCGSAGEDRWGEMPYTCMGPAQSLPTPG